MTRLFALSVLALALFARPVAAQEAIDRLADALELSDAQVEIVEDVYRAGDAGSVWTMLAELEPTLTETQRAALLTRPERPSGAGTRQGRGGQGGRGGRGNRPGRSDAEQAAERAARDAALGLDAGQSAALDAATTARRGSGTGDDVEVPSSLSSRQAEMIQMQRGLMRLTRAPRGGTRG